MDGSFDMVWYTREKSRVIFISNRSFLRPIEIAVFAKQRLLELQQKGRYLLSGRSAFH